MNDNRISVFLGRLGRDSRLMEPYTPESDSRTPNPWGLKWDGLQKMKHCSLLTPRSYVFTVWHLGKWGHSGSCNRKALVGKAVLGSGINSTWLCTTHSALGPELHWEAQGTSCPVRGDRQGSPGPAPGSVLLARSFSGTLPRSPLPS